MSKIFFDIKRRDYLALGASPDKDDSSPLVYPSCFFLSSLPEAVMKINPPYKDVPYNQEKLKIHNRLIGIYQATIANWESSEPDYPLLPKVKEQLIKELKMWADITGDQPCR